MNLVETAKGTALMSAVEARKEQEQWRIESDMRTLMEAEEIRRDPKRFEAARKMAQTKLVELGAVAGAAPAK